MSGAVWALTGAMAGVFFIVGLWLFIRGGFPRQPVSAPVEEGGKAPMALQQKRAWWGLAIGIALALALVTVVAVRGAASYREDLTTRMLTLGIFALGVTGYFTMLALTRKGEGRSGIVLDERDRAIMTRAMSVSLIAGFLTLIAWTIGLTEAYWEAGVIPIDFPSFITWSTFVVAMVGRELGILMGYAGWHSHGEG